MADRKFQPDLTGSDETLEQLLARLRSFPMKLRPARLPPDSERTFTSRRPPRGVGGAEAPISVEKPLPDCHAPI